MLFAKPLNFFVALLLLCLLAWQSAALIWQLFAPPSASGVVTSQPVSTFTPQPIHLFGRADVNASSTMQMGMPDANLVQGWLLLGTVLDGEHSLALVQMGTGGLRWLKVGERLDNGLQVVTVSTNEVQLLTAQGVKSLNLYSKQIAAVNPVITPTPTGSNASLQAVRSNLKQNPMSAMKLMRMDPIWANGQLSGLTLMPQSGQEGLFNQLGLKAGDILVGLNGEPVGAWMLKMADLPKVLDANGARIKVLRSGAETEWTVNW